VSNSKHKQLDMLGLGRSRRYHWNGEMGNHGQGLRVIVSNTLKSSMNHRCRALSRTNAFIDRREPSDINLRVDVDVTIVSGTSSDEGLLVLLLKFSSNFLVDMEYSRNRSRGCKFIRIAMSNRKGISTRDSNFNNARSDN
jgi:hypothetical protein